MIEVGKSSGNQFKAEFFSGALTHSLSSSAPLTITPPAGKTLRLDYLSSQGASYTVDVTVGSTVAISSKLLSNAHTDSAGSFVISNGITNGTNSAKASNTVQPLIAFEPDQPITISQSNQNLNPIYYSYSYGE